MLELQPVKAPLLTHLHLPEQVFFLGGERGVHSLTENDHQRLAVLELGVSIL